MSMISAVEARLSPTLAPPMKPLTMLPTNHLHEHEKAHTERNRLRFSVRFVHLLQSIGS